jgi:hypothetical protein
MRLVERCKGGDIYKRLKFGSCYFSIDLLKVRDYWVCGFNMQILLRGFDYFYD